MFRVPSSLEGACAVRTATLPTCCAVACLLLSVDQISLVFAAVATPDCKHCRAPLCAPMTSFPSVVSWWNVNTLISPVRLLCQNGLPIHRPTGRRRTGMSGEMAKSSAYPRLLHEREQTAPSGSFLWSVPREPLQEHQYGVMRFVGSPPSTISLARARRCRLGSSLVRPELVCSSRTAYGLCFPARCTR